jgi:fused signal recognition particle receptor
MHDLVIALVAAVVVVGGGGTGVVTLRRRRRPPGPAGRTSPPSTRPADRPTAPPSGARPSVDERPSVDAGPSVDERPSVAVPAAVDAPTPAAVDAAAVDAAAVDADAVEAAAVDADAGDVDADDAAAVDLLELGERPRLRDRLGKARSLLGGYLTGVRSRERIEAATWDDLEEALILADVGVEVTTAILDDLRAQVRAGTATTPDELVDLLRGDLITRLEGDRELHLADDVTNVWLFVGVNGVGKTTTIGKVGLRQRSEGRTVLMAAGDTFRAAAAEQLGMWADRVGVELVRGSEGGDPGAVIFDAVQHAAARHVQLVLGDTAGRLHTKVNLMEELKKVRRVAERPPGQVSEVLLVIDATTGQNGLIQAKQFAAAVGVTGVVLTKLDGTAKGGIALAIQTELGIPIKLVGVGESASDLIPFDPVEFVDALVSADA